MKKLILSFLVLYGTSVQAEVFIQQPESEKTCAVVFGAAVWKDDKPSHALYDRIKTATDLYNDELVDCLILSGGASTYGSHEVDVMKNVAIDEKVEEDDLFFDYEGINTEATIRNLPEEEDHYVFVSNDFHLARIQLLAKKIGVDSFETYPAIYHRGRYQKDDWFKFREFGGSLYTIFFVW